MIISYLYNELYIINVSHTVPYNLHFDLPCPHIFVVNFANVQQIDSRSVLRGMNTPRRKFCKGRMNKSRNYSFVGVEQNVNNMVMLPAVIVIARLHVYSSPVNIHFLDSNS